MKGDFSRIGFDAANHFSRVLLQQGRVTLDADPNEAGEILLHYLRTLARDLIGPCGGPADALGFQLTVQGEPGSLRTLGIGAGRYYIDGVLVENDAPADYAEQAWSPADNDPVLQRLRTPEGDDVWLYLDVWERHVSAVEVDAIRESALGGPDTCTRTQVVWQVRGISRPALLAQLAAQRDTLDARLADTTLPAAERAALEARRAHVLESLERLGPNGANGGFDCNAPFDALTGLSDALLTARLDPGQQPKDPCILAPDVLYRGVENHLYRVEVHRGSGPGQAPTFKWSRDNGSLATRWLATDGNDLVVASSRGFTAGCWVELSDDTLDLRGEPGVLVKLAKVEAGRLTVHASQPVPPLEGLKHPKVRRWDQAESDDVVLDDGAVAITEPTATRPDVWVTLEDGLQVRFGAGGTYRSGDHWLITARVATGDIDWPRDTSATGAVTWRPRPPRGVEHHYASLGYLGIDAAGTFGITPCLCTIEPVNSCSRARAANGGVAAPTRRPLKGKVK